MRACETWLARWPVYGSHITMLRAKNFGKQLRHQFKTTAMRTEKNHALALRKSLCCQGFTLHLDMDVRVLQQRRLVRPQPQFGQFGHKAPRLGNGGPG